jgi:hypothetical protein
MTSNLGHCETGGQPRAELAQCQAQDVMIRYFEESNLLRAFRARHFMSIRELGRMKNCQVSDEHQRHRGRNCILDLRIRL